MNLKLHPFLSGALIFGVALSIPEGKLKIVAWGILSIFACYGYWKAGGIIINKDNRGKKK